MTEIIENYRSCGLGWTLRCVTVAALLLLSGAESSVRPQEQTNTDKITIGQPIVRELKGGEQHVFLLTLSAGEYTRVAVDQRGIDVVFGLLDADRKPLFEVDNNLSGTRGPEVISVIAEDSRAYVFSVRSPGKDATAGRYELRIEALRPATEVDRTRVAADRAYLAAAKSQGEGTGDSRL
jgi:hypothetical protein